MNIDAGEFSERLRTALRALPDKSIKSYGISMDCAEITVNYKGDAAPVVVRVEPDLTVGERVQQVVNACGSYATERA